MKGKKKNFMSSFVIIFLFQFLLNATATKSATTPCPQPRKHFVLVHGACHGAWSWYKLMELLRSAGHNVTALDLAASGINPKQVYDVKHISDYFQPLRDFMSHSIPPHERFILVGHSYGGLAISQAMEMFPEKIAVAVFVTALMPGPRLNVSTLNQESLRRQSSILDSHFLYDNGPNNPPTVFVFGPKHLSSKVYQRSPSEDLALATVLLRPMYLYTDEDLSKELMLSTRKYGSVSRVFIIADEDKLAGKAFQRWMIEKNPPDEVDEIKGSDHMVMISKPVELLVRLHCIAGKYS
ncbi:hypothetical protein ACH5RR_002279 [Cinchona calisaya]|uniref:AB hydrolase-1 domain-containing protein n=1 Tax=Cinchona calisaya TaxID=153742 RepID=A0ABD3B5T6_9GENT